MPAGLRQELGDFLGKSVTDNTRKGYERYWTQWGTFMQRVGGGDDLYMRTYREEDKAAMAALFLRDQHQRGLRDKAATAASAGIRLEFTRALEATDFLDNPIATAARGARGSSAAELCCLEVVTRLERMIKIGGYFKMCNTCDES